MESKIIELKEQKYSDREIIENIFLNYPSKYQNDIIYRIKKKMSEYFNVPINNIKLIGSAHSGIKIKENDTIFDLDPNDLDFAIIDSRCYSKELLRIKESKSVKYTSRDRFNGNLFFGKIHYAYVKQDQDQSEFFSSLEKELGMEKKISICIYISEDFFLAGLESFYQDKLTKYYEKYRENKRDISNLELKGVKEFK